MSEVSGLLFLPFLLSDSEVDWADNARDILNFLLHYIPTDLTSEPLPTHLTRVSEPETGYRKTYGLPGRKLIAVAHSFGGCTVYLFIITSSSGNC